METAFFIFNEVVILIIAKLTPKGYDETSRAHIFGSDQYLLPVARSSGRIRPLPIAVPSFEMTRNWSA